MLPESAKAIEIADKHLVGKSPARRAALAKDILVAIKEYAEQMATDAIKEAYSSATPRVN
jgi:hypothetical protein